MRGAELKAKYRQLCERHNVRPVAREVLALLSPVAGPQIVTGLASSPMVDFERMSFAQGALHFDTLPPLYLRHDTSHGVVGRILDLAYHADGLQIRAEVTDLDEAVKMPALSIAATVLASEVRNEDSPSGFHFVITSARLDEVSLTDRPSCSTALILSRRDVLASDTVTDDVLASVARCRAALEQLRAAWSSQENRKSSQVEDSFPEPEPPPLRPTRSMPARIYGSLPAAIIEPRRNSFRDLIAHLPTGDGP